MSCDKDFTINDCYAYCIQVSSNEYTIDKLHSKKTCDNNQYSYKQLIQLETLASINLAANNMYCTNSDNIVLHGRKNLQL